MGRRGMSASCSARGALCELRFTQPGEHTGRLPPGGRQTRVRSTRHYPRKARTLFWPVLDAELQQVKLPGDRSAGLRRHRWADCAGRAFELIAATLTAKPELLRLMNTGSLETGRGYRSHGAQQPGTLGRGWWPPPSGALGGRGERSQRKRQGVPFLRWWPMVGELSLPCIGLFSIGGAGHKAMFKAYADSGSNARRSSRPDPHTRQWKRRQRARNRSPMASRSFAAYPARDRQFFAGGRGPRRQCASVVMPTSKWRAGIEVACLDRPGESFLSASACLSALLWDRLLLGKYGFSPRPLAVA